MTPALLAANGVMHRRDLVQHLLPHLIEYGMRSGRLVRPFPQVYVLREFTDDPMTTVRAALCFAGPRAVLSHTTGVAIWGLSDLVGPADPVHVDIGPKRPHVKAQGLVVHRRRQSVEPVMRSGHPVYRLEVSLLDSWDWLKNDDPLRRALVIEAVGRRMTTPARIACAFEQRSVVAGIAQLRRLVNLLDAGCRSELELWGYDHVFRDFPFLERNVPVDLGGRTIYLDLLDRRTLTNVELDGRRFHMAPADRERDLRRDAALAARGYLVLRISGARLHREPEVVRAEVAAIVAARGRRS